jgi:hypothetical protein
LKAEGDPFRKRLGIQPSCLKLIVAVDIDLLGAAIVGSSWGVAAILPSASPFYFYAPIREGFATTPSNQAFDRSVRDRNSTWGLRNLEAVAAIAQSVGLSAPGITEMPANNLSAVFRRM